MVPAASSTLAAFVLETDPMSCIVAKATLGDLDALAVLLDGYRQFYGQPSDPARAHAFLQERMELRESCILLARDATGQAQGFTQLYPLFSSVRAVRAWLLNDLFVAPGARRQGVAKALLAAAAVEAKAGDIGYLMLWTALDNAPAQAVYAAMGWERDAHTCEYSLTL